MAALFSCSAGQRAFEHESIKHGVFFHYVIEGLKGSAANIDNEISFGDLSSFVMRRVSRNVKSIVGENAIQSPNLVNDLVGESPVLALGRTNRDRDVSAVNSKQEAVAGKSAMQNQQAPPMKEMSDSAASPDVKVGVSEPISKEGTAKPETATSVGMEFVLIQNGTFTMGSPADDQSDKFGRINTR